jgi:hypothetical protein
MRKVLGIALVIMAAMVCVSAQKRQHQARYTEGTGVTFKVDKPATEAEAFSPGTSFSYPVEDFKPGVVKVGPRTTYLKEGLRTDEVIQLLGKPVSISERTENDVVVTTYEFQRGEGRVLIAEFEAGVLVRSRTEARDVPAVQAGR